MKKIYDVYEQDIDGFKSNVGFYLGNNPKEAVNLCIKDYGYNEEAEDFLRATETTIHRIELTKDIVEKRLDKLNSLCNDYLKEKKQ